MKALRERIGRERLYFDGGTGSVLQSLGLKGGELPERWNLTRPGDIAGLHQSYFEAGSDIVNSNTFGANRLHYPDPEELHAIIRRGVELVREGMRLSGRSDGYVALDIGPTGRLLSPMGDLDFEEAVSIFGEVIRCGAEAGADLVMIETMSDTQEARAAVLAAKENCSLPVFITVVFDESARMLTGGTVESVVAILESLHVDALGLNCSLGPSKLKPIAEAILKRASVPVICNPNAGLPRSEGGRTVYDLDAAAFAEEMTEIASIGVHMLGGCCGTTPEYIREMIARTRELPFTPPMPKHHTVVSSASRALFIGERPLIIGERINPTGKKRFKEALREGDTDYILQQGITQEDAGADMLDVNVGLPEIDEPTVMETIVTGLQSICPLPLQIDTSDTEALERGLRICNGRPLINSVNGKRESLDAVLPLAAKYGGVLVALPLDEKGIPDTADGRLAIAKRILVEAAGYGIRKEDIVVDGLAMTISTDASSANTTLETIRRLRRELGVHTILGVSNISFGLPQREIINSTFFAMALREGLSLAIINPNSSAMMAAHRAYCALSGLDPACASFIGAYGDKKGLCFGLYDPEDNLKTAVPGAFPGSAKGNGALDTGVSPVGAGETGGPSAALISAVLGGMASLAVRAAREAFSTGTKPLEIVSACLVPALDTVGKRYENGSIFLPQLLMSAEAAKAAFDVIREYISGGTADVKGRMILATVKGDIHDIGKNIVKVLLENYGYDVIDLGKDVPPEVIVETAIKEKIALVGLSALMTTTVVGMEETIRLLREKKPDTKIVVGGAVMNREYAASIGADYYAREAMDTVRYADRIFGVIS